MVIAGVVRRTGKGIIVVIGILVDAEHQLANVVPANATNRFFLGTGQSGKHQGRQQRRYEDNYHHLHQGEPCGLGVPVIPEVKNHRHTCFSN